MPAKSLSTLQPKEIKPQAGPQEIFLSTSADIAIFGGSAGGGKSYALLLETLRFATNVPGFSAVVFRRTTPSIRNPGALWDESIGLFSELKGKPSKHNLEWVWPDGGKVKFAHLEYDDTVHDWHGSQIALIAFDELCEFTFKQFTYMMSRNRSTCGVKPYIRATCNPDADSWVAEFISWWIDQETGFPIFDRGGVLRWFVRIGDEVYWADSPEELTHEKLKIEKYMPDGTEVQLLPKSVTFIPATIYDNKKLLEADPGYLGNLLALPIVERERLLKGNWKIRPAAGLLFRREWVELVDAVPPNLEYVRGWDLAATPKTPLNNPDWTVGTKIGHDKKSGDIYIVDNVRLRDSPAKVESEIKRLATSDGPRCGQYLPEDPGQAGKSQKAHITRSMMGLNIRFSKEEGDKESRFNGFSAYAQSGHVKVRKGAWNESWFTTLEAFPDESAHDDDVDSTSRAFNALCLSTNTGLLLYYDRLVSELEVEEATKSLPPPRTVDDGGIRVVGPNEDVNVIHDFKGHKIWKSDDGTFVVDTKLFEALKKSGFKEVQTVERIS